MGVRLVRYNNGIITGSSGFGGTYDHNELTGRDLANQHPISAISGLEETLEELQSLIDAIINKFEDSRSIHFSTDDSTKTLTANVKIFNSEDNAIQEKVTGLFVDKYPDIETEDTKSVHLYVEGAGETLESMYNNGNVFSHNGGTNNIANASEASAWYFDKNLGSFVQPLNTGTFTGFVSNIKYRTYTHRATLRSSDGDNDANGLVIAYVKDGNGNPHTLSCIVNKGGESHAGSFYYALVYNKSLSGEQTIRTGVMGSGHSTGGWNNSYITMEVSKAGSTVECSISNWNSLTINPNTVMSVDLNNYSWGHYFTGKVQYGYCNQSQAKSYFTDIYFQGKGPLKGSVIISTDEGNALELRDNGLYCGGGGGSSCEEATKEQIEQMIKEIWSSIDWPPSSTTIVPTFITKDLKYIQTKDGYYICTSEKEDDANIETFITKDFKYIQTKDGYYICVNEEDNNTQPFITEDLKHIQSKDNYYIYATKN